MVRYYSDIQIKQLVSNFILVFKGFQFITLVHQLILILQILNSKFNWIGDFYTSSIREAQIKGIFIKLMDWW